MWLNLRQVALVADDLGAAVEDLRAVFGLEVGFRDPGVSRFGIDNAVLPVGSQFIEVLAPNQPDTAAGRHLERRGGPGGYMVITHTDHQEALRDRAQELGIRTVLESEEHDGYRCWQLHPSDTGGIWLEVDSQVGSEDPMGPWVPAGPSWQEAVRTDVVDGIRTVEVQAGEPARVAALWSELTDIPVLDGEGPPTLTLGRGDIRFLPVSDGRGSGVAGVELSARDPERALSAAHQRGLLRDGVITICGTRFVLEPSG